MEASSPCGCLLRLPSGREASMPLLSVSAQVHIVDVLARVTLTQYFANPNRSDVPTDVKYTFPVPVGGAVCAFEMHTMDGKIVVGEVKEARKAEAEFREAVAQKKTAGLLAKATPDVFTLSLDAIAPEQSIKAVVTFVTELADDEFLKQARFSLPTYVGQRYGASPLASHSQTSVKKHAKFTFAADIIMTSAIIQVVSPSHSVKIVPQESDGLRSRCSVILDSSTGASLDKDFVLSIKTSDIDAPRCVAEPLRDKRSVALSLTLVPRFGVKPIDSQEYIFLIDRSGSMSGQMKIDYAKKALLIMLKSLPNTGTRFNIFSFGSESSSLWPSSEQYTEASLRTALLHVDSMEADLGGTEIASALKSVLKSRITTKPTSIFVLTDGEIWNVDSLLDELRNSVAAAGDSSSGKYLRVFTLGVGHGASSALCNGLARAGNGICLMTTQSEDMAGKCARLLRASRVPPSGNLRDVCIDWGYAVPDAPRSDTSYEQLKRSPVNAPEAALRLFDEEYDPLAPTEDTGFPQAIDSDNYTASNIQQAPSVVPNFYPGNRFIVSAILSNTTQLPESVVLRGETPDGTTTELKLPVHAVHSEGSLPLVHILAAHRIIQELEDGYIQCLGMAKNVDSRHYSDIARAAVVRYSTEYQLASKYASFVAVEKDRLRSSLADDSGFEVLNGSDIDPDEWVDNVERASAVRGAGIHTNENRYTPNHTTYSRAHSDADESAYARTSTQAEYPVYQWTQPRMFSAPAMSATAPVIFAAAPPLIAMAADDEGDGGDDDDDVEDYDVWVPRGVPRARTPSFAPIIRCAIAEDVPEREPAVPDDPVTAITRLQSFEGSFSLNEPLRKLIFSDKLTLDNLRGTIPSAIRSHFEAEKIWATALAVAYLRTKANDLSDIWAGLWEKANGFVVRALAGDALSFDQVVLDAMKLL